MKDRIEYDKTKEEMTIDDYKQLGFKIMGEFKHNVKQRFSKIFKRKKSK